MKNIFSLQISPVLFALVSMFLFGIFSWVYFKENTPNVPEPSPSEDVSVLATPISSEVVGETASESFVIGSGTVDQNGIATIPELNLQMKAGSDLRDLTYEVAYHNENVDRITFNTDSFVSKEESYDPTLDCPIGGFSVFTTPQGEPYADIQVGKFYISPFFRQEVCVYVPSDPEAEKLDQLQSQQVDLLRNAIKTLTPIGTGL